MQIKYSLQYNSQFLTFSCLLYLLLSESSILHLYFFPLFYFLRKCLHSAPMFEEMNLLCKVQVSATTKIINLFPIVVKPVPESSRGVNNSQFISFLRLTASSSQLSDKKVSLFIKYLLKRKQFAV